ncbi:MAG: peptidyl-prolyl cis-trans isomerase [Lachnospiraceae bacterium]|nr:peptidyl-prolyl cis-trans isomerase [Lachnospiraceae bacterium]
MKKSTRVLGITAGMMAALFLTGCNAKDTDTVATVYGTPVTVGEAGLFATYQQAQYEAFYSMYLGTTVDWSQTYEGDKTMEDQTKEGVLEQFKKMQIVASHAADYNISISEEEQAKIEEAATKLIEANDEKAQKALHMSKESAVSLFETYYLYNKVSEVMVADVNTEVSDEEAAQKKMSYIEFSLAGTTDEEGNTVELTEDEKAAVKAKAEAVVTAGAAEMENAITGTDYSVLEATFDEESDTLDTAVYEAANKLKEGEMSSVIETETAYYVVRLDSNFDKEATESKKESIVEERKTEAFDKVYEGWETEEDAFVLDESAWKSIRFKDKISLKTEEAEASEETTEDVNAEGTEDASGEAVEETAEATPDAESTENAAGETTEE